MKVTFNDLWCQISQCYVSTHSVILQLIMLPFIASFFNERGVLSALEKLVNKYSEVLLLVMKKNQILLLK